MTFEVTTPVLDLSKKQLGVERRRRENRGSECAKGRGGVPLPTREGARRAGYSPSLENFRFFFISK